MISEEDPSFGRAVLHPIAKKGLSIWLGLALRLLPVHLSWHSEKTLHFVTMAHQLAWMEHPAIWLCESCAILWLVLRLVRSPWFGPAFCSCSADWG